MAIVNAMDDFNGRVVEQLTSSHAAVIVIVLRLRWDDNSTEVCLGWRAVFDGNRCSLYLFVGLICYFPDFRGIEVQNLINKLIVKLL